MSHPQIGKKPEVWQHALLAGLWGDGPGASRKARWHNPTCFPFDAAVPSLEVCSEATPKNEKRKRLETRELPIIKGLVE